MSVDVALLKRGAVVKNIALTDNVRQVDGNLNGFRLVLGAHFLKQV